MAWFINNDNILWFISNNILWFINDNNILWFITNGIFCKYPWICLREVIFVVIF